MDDRSALRSAFHAVSPVIWGLFQLGNQTVLVEAYLELHRNEHFDVKGMLLRGNLAEIIENLLSVGPERAGRIMRRMKQRGAYTISDRRLIFHGTDEARELFAGLD